MNRLFIFIAGAVAGYVASGWIEGFCGKKNRVTGGEGSVNEPAHEEA